MRLPEYVAHYLLANDVALRTASDYRWIARYFDRDTHLELDGLTAARINAYLVALKERGWEPPSLKSMRNKVLVLWKAAYRDGFTDNPPDPDRVRKIKVPRPNPVGFSAAEMRTLIGYCERELRHHLISVHVPAGDYLAALFSFLWDTGMRLGDALTMEFERLRTGRVIWRQSKTGVWHVADLSPRTLATIERIRQPERALVWPRPATNRTSLYRSIKTAIRGAGLTGTSKHIRRGVATDVYLSGGDPAQALGHVPGSRVAYRHYVSMEAQLAPVSPTAL